MIELNEQSDNGLEEEVKHSCTLINQVKAEVGKKIVGQEVLIRNLIISFLAQGHIIVEGVPGLAKTLSIETLSKTLDLDYSRIQFTPDLLPSDLIGTKVFDQKKADFFVKKGPIFSNFVLADEINRAPSKVQSALLEAMAERHVTIGEQTFELKNPFIVLATENPIEQEGTYNLPEAQLDRFLLKTIVKYPSEDEEIKIMQKFHNNYFEKVKKIMTGKQILDMQSIVEKIHVSQSIFEYIKNIVYTSRFPDKFGLGELENMMSYGASPRASLALINCSKVLALMNGRTFVIPEDIKEIAYDILRHRIVLSYETLAQDITADEIIKKILDNTKIF